MDDLKERLRKAKITKGELAWLRSSGPVTAKQAAEMMMHFCALSQDALARIEELEAQVAKADAMAEAWDGFRNADMSREAARWHRRAGEAVTAYREAAPK